MKLRLPAFVAAIVAACGSEVLDGPWPGSRIWGWGDSPGTDAPRYNQRKARRNARRVNKAVQR